MGDNQRVVAGYDGSPEAALAMRWAAEVAQRRGLPLRVVSAAGAGAGRGGADGDRPSSPQAMAEQGAQIASAAADVVVDALGVDGGAVASLVAQSEEAQLLVMGNRGRGRLRGALLGSSAFSAVIHAKCPVAIVRDSLRPLPSPDYPVVVGTDGSSSSEGAVLEAARLAAETGATVKIVVAYSAPSNAPWLVAHYPDEVEQGTDRNVWERQAFDPDIDGTSSEQRQKEAAGIARDAADKVREAHPEADVELLVVPGRPERAIVDAAESASVIVVGARGRGDFASLLLGSVSRDVIQNADCAVYVVR